ncbi:hypothetical protein K440DRAFT_602761 [Wilcoxina mikolae CBS 423.85]|nr:hypothetical protein K440DRAFT_602761 [Wilcoxina mikolae CBS 423.85]
MSRPSTTTNLYPPSTSYATYPGSSQASPNTRTLTLWIHDPDQPQALSRHEAVLNYDLFPDGVAKPGDVAEVRLIPQASSSGGNISSEGYSSGNGNGHLSDNGSGALLAERRPMQRRASCAGSTIGEERSSSSKQPPKEEEHKFLFVIRELEESQRKLNVQISLASHVAALFGFPSRATVRVSIVDKPLHEASHVEIFFRDQYITRSDIWRLTTSLLSDTCPYKSQKLLFINSIRATVGNVWVRGEKVRSAYFSSRTVPIFRSESSTYVIFIQMSREMWHFDTYDGGDGEDNSGDGIAGGTGGVGGDILFNKLINGFLPELFKRWRRFNANHLVSIVLFTRVVYEHGEPVGVISTDGEGEEFLGSPGGIEIGEGRRYRDFFRVVTSNMGSADWTVILHRLKREFAIFLRDVSVQPVPNDDNPDPGMMDLTPPVSSAASIASRPGTPAMLPVDKFRPPATPGQSPRLPATIKGTRPKTIITGRPSSAIHGNILEAINLATIQFSRSHVDVNLTRTGVSIVLVTPGTGLFEVDYEMLKATTEGLIANGMGIDLVCLSKAPLHTVPLFRYRNPTPAHNGSEENSMRAGMSPPKQQSHQLQPGEWVYAMPHWIDISFWSSASEKKTRRSRDPVDGEASKKKETKLQKKKSSQIFRARCKIYELQMMGIVEDETSCITVPFLHDNPLWKPFPEEGPSREVVGKDAERKRKEQWKEDNFGWMDEYDDTVFRPLPVYKEVLRQAEERRSGADEEQRKILQTLQEDELGTSFCGDLTRPTSVRSGFFDRKMKERRPELESPVEPKTPPPKTPPPPTLVTDTSSIRSGGLLAKPAARLRQINFGFKAWGGATKSAAKAATTTDVTGLGTMVTRGFDTSEHSLASPKSNAPLSPKGTIRELRTAESPEKPQTSWGTRPISITGANAATISLDAVSRDKDRRRSFAGSPLELRTQSGIRDLEIMKAASSLSRPAGPRNDLVANAEKTANIPLTVSPTSAIAPWVQVLNPSNPKKNPHTLGNQYRPWHHVFPKPVKMSSVKWKSLCTPALLPLTTEHFPTAEQLATEYQESPYVISQNSDYELGESAGNREALVRAMIALRLTQGFQIVVGNRVTEATQGRGDQMGIYDQNYMCTPGSSCFMSRGSQIHQLICDEEYNVEVKRYIRKPANALVTKKSENDEYTSYIKTLLKPDFKPVKASFHQPVSDYNWNYADQYIAGYEDLKDQLRYWRARFVLIPCDPPESARRGPLSGAELNDEEIHIEGIRRLTTIFQRNRYVPPEERHYERHGPRQKGKETNPLQILYKTVDPSIAVAQELESLFVPDIDGHMRRSQLLTTELFESKNLDIKAIAQELQGPRGVRLQDRRWHLKFHNNCFIGEEMVTWIVENFKDVNTRQEAEMVGKDLLVRGLFQHVDRRHEFRDGNYFYRIAEAFANPPRPSSKGSWFPTFKSDKSVPPTPSTDNSTSASSPLHRARSRSSTMLTEDSLTSTTPTACHPNPQKKKVEVDLSKSMKYDVDPSRKSYRPEVITLHYDRLHNPDNCYHIRIDWMNTTSKLISDCVTSWARTMDRFGLKLVEAPIDEVSRITNANLFRAPSVMKLALAPPPPPSPHQSVSTISTENMELSTILNPLIIPPQPQDPWLYHKLILKKFNFVLDTEAASNFPEDVKVKYSWGVLDYQWSQYIHRSGVIFCQLSDVGEFYLMANRAYTMRMSFPTSQHNRGNGGVAGGGTEADMPLTPERIKEDMEAFLGDPEKLRAFYEEVMKARSPKTLVGGRWDSPIIAPVGVVRMGSPTVGASGVHVMGGNGRMGSVSGGSGEEGLGEFLLAK